MTTLKRYTGSAWETIGQSVFNSGPAATLGYAEITADTAATAASADAGISVTITVPAGRRIRLTAEALLIGNTDAAGARLMIMEGGNILRLADAGIYGAKQEDIHTDVIISPTAGTHTYKVMYSVWTGGGTVKIGANGQYPAYLLVEDITGSTLPYDPASVPVGVLAYAPVIANQNFTTLVNLTGMSVNVVVPAGRQIRITARVYLSTTVASDSVSFYISEGATNYQVGDVFMAAASRGQIAETSVVISPTAGMHIYNVRAERSAGSGTITANASAQAPAFILVEDITPTPAASTGAPGSTLGYAEVVANQGSITTEADLTGLVATVTVPAGRRLRITGYVGSWASTAAGDRVILAIKEGATQLNRVITAEGETTVGNQSAGGVIQHVVSPSAGTHTYKLTAAQADAGTITMFASATQPAFILVEDITGSVWPAGVAVTAGMVASEAWTDYVPTLTNMTLGNGTIIARYQKIGRLVTVKFSFTMGSTSAMGTSPRFSLPFAAQPAAYPDYHILGLAQMTDVTTNLWMGFTQYHVVSGMVNMRVTSASGTYVGFTDITATVPFTWANTYSINTQFQYEAAA